MKFPQFWAKGRHRMAVCWRWSDASQSDAQRQADARAVELAALFDSGEQLNRYSYGIDRPLREEIVETIVPDAALVSRNLYGALVLNTSRAMFVDIDFEGGGDERGHLEAIRGFSARHRDVAMRVYRTAAGLRGLVTSRTFDPAAPETLSLLKELRSDPLYVKLCQSQASFRARLTPKPWRCALPVPPWRWPFVEPGSEAQFRAWQTRYDEQRTSYSTCKLLEVVGGDALHPEVAPVLDAHDRAACGEGPLA